MSLLLSFFLPSVSLAAFPPPLITVPPLSQTVLKNTSATFLVVATSITTMSYQWRLNGQNITGATQASYTVAPTKQNGTYSVEVINAGGSVISPNATLTVLSPPEATDDTYATLEDAALSVPAPGVLANDTDLSLISARAYLASNVRHGTLSFNTDGSFTYVSFADYNGTDSFTYRPSDGIVTGNVARVTISITPVNDPPIAIEDSTNTVQNGSVVIHVLANDSDIDSTNVVITGVTTTNGTAVVAGTNILFTPALDFYGTVVFGYTISDGAASASAQVTVAVAYVNRIPVATHDHYPLAMNSSISHATPGVLANDTDFENEPLSAVLVSDVSHGTLLLNLDGSFTYTPVSNYFGYDSFTYRAVDASSTGTVATVTLRVINPLPFNLTATGMASDGFHLQVSGPLPATYVILASTELQTWTSISTNAASVGPIDFTDTEAAKYPARFYKALAR